VTISGDLTSAPASALVRAIRAREISSRELLGAYLDRIEQVNRRSTPSSPSTLRRRGPPPRPLTSSSLAVRNPARSTACR
jgi:Asp-tRNA(Asn)/Glu-tRNA(Gln) amidotransferase A subunit family amidase